MPQIPIVMPQLGESIAEATIVSFRVAAGDEVVADQEIIEVETNKATMGVTVPCAGKIAALHAEVGASYPVGAILGLVEVTEEAAKKAGLTPASDNHKKPPEVVAESARSHFDTSDSNDLPDYNRQPAEVAPTVRGLPVPLHAKGASYLSPRMKARMQELGLHAADLAGVAGSGAGGRVTIEDFENFLSDLESKTITPASTMRVAVADAMRRSWTRPLATVGLFVSMEPLLAFRRKAKRKPGPALVALRALALALGENRKPAGRLIGGRIVHPSAIDIGFAVEAEDGVLVPVLRGADAVPLADLIPRYDDLVEMARQRRLQPEASGGSIATVTNFGTFGIEWATPIPLPEQTLVLGLGAGTKRPFWDEQKQAFVPVVMSGLTLSFDHRVLDGGGAGRLLARVAELMQHPETL
ncbi:MAG: 2-oxo acid dehydrogenase subunit E2 [Verrucomicrobiia bacterium]